MTEDDLKEAGHCGPITKETEQQLEEFSDDFQVRHWAQRRAIGKKLFPFILAEERRSAAKRPSEMKWC